MTPASLRERLLEFGFRVRESDYPGLRAAIREAAALLAEPTQEPVAWRVIVSAVSDGFVFARYVTEERPGLPSHESVRLDVTPLYEVATRAAMAAPTDTVKVPESVEEARAMALLGIGWLEEYAPDQLTDAYRGLTAPVEVPEPLSFVSYVWPPTINQTEEPEEYCTVRLDRLRRVNEFLKAAVLRTPTNGENT